EKIDEFTTTAPNSDERVFSRWIAAATELVSAELGLSTPTIIPGGQRFPGPGDRPHTNHPPGRPAPAAPEPQAARGLAEDRPARRRRRYAVRTRPPGRAAVAQW